MCLFYEASDGTGFKHCSEIVGFLFCVFLLWGLFCLSPLNLIRDLQ